MANAENTYTVRMSGTDANLLANAALLAANYTRQQARSRANGGPALKTARQALRDLADGYEEAGERLRASTPVTEPTQGL